MKYQHQLTQLRIEHSTFLPAVVNTEACSKAVQELRAINGAGELDIVAHKYIEQFSTAVFSTEILQFLQAYYQQEYEWRWPTLDIIDDTALESYYSTTWHCDNCPENMLKFFLYLNPTSEHHCTTEIIDALRTTALQKQGALPIELELRSTDLSGFLKEQNASLTTLTYDLEAGDVLVFSPKLLAHRCIPPKTNKKRYTICYSIYPKSYFA